MKHLITLVLIFSIHHVFAQKIEDSPNSKCLQNLEKEGEVIKEKELTPRLEKLANCMCIDLKVAGDAGVKNIAQRIENHILKYLEISREDKNYKLKVSNFWNQNAEHLICYNSPQDFRVPQQFMKRVVEMKMYSSVLDEFLLLDRDEYPINVNHIEIYNGKPETVLDFLNDIIETNGNGKVYVMEEIVDLRDILIDEYQAKTAEEVLKERAVKN